MTRPRAKDGEQLTDRAWGIYDAQAFYVGNSKTAHAVHSFPTWHSVRGVCGVVANTYDYDRYDRLAEWAGLGVTCPTCKERS